MEGDWIAPAGGVRRAIPPAEKKPRLGGEVGQFITRARRIPRRPKMRRLSIVAERPDAAEDGRATTPHTYSQVFARRSCTGLERFSALQSHALHFGAGARCR